MARIDHLVVCVHDIERAALTYEALGFTLTPVSEHPFGTRNRLALFADNFIELLAIADPAKIPAAALGHFSFAAHNQAFLGAAEGMSMLVWHSSDAHADAARFAATGLGAYAPVDFGRDARLPDGTITRFDFSLAFATDPALPGLAFFTCQQRHAPNLFWRPEYQRHPNSASRVIEIVLSAPQPDAHRDFLERATQGPATPLRGGLTTGAPGNRVTVLDPPAMARRFPGLLADANSRPRFFAARLAVADLDAAERQLRSDGVPFRTIDTAIVVPPAVAHGLDLELVTATEGAE
jgi:hypothetical protein